LDGCHEFVRLLVVRSTSAKGRRMLQSRLIWEENTCSIFSRSANLTLPFG